MNTGICNTHTFLQASWSLRREVLPPLQLEFGINSCITFVNIALNHNTTNKTFSFCELSRNIFRDKGLILVIFQGISMRTINHDAFVQDFRFRHSYATCLNRFGIEVCSIFATANQQNILCSVPSKDDETILIAFRTSDSS
jgi:hypothetical protein